MENWRNSDWRFIWYSNWKKSWRTDSNETESEVPDSNEPEPKESTESHARSDKEDKNNAQEGEEITFEEQAEKANIKISFWQLSQFKSTIELITFILYILVSDQINKGLEIKLFINLINIESERKDETKKVVRSFKGDVSPLESHSLQGELECSMVVQKNIIF